MMAVWRVSGQVTRQRDLEFIPSSNFRLRFKFKLVFKMRINSPLNVAIELNDCSHVKLA